MYIVTNRAFSKVGGDTGYEFKDKLNPKGDKELRLFRATPIEGSDMINNAPNNWRIEIIPDRPQKSEFEDLEDGFIQPRSRRRFGSDLVAAEILTMLSAERRNIVLFVHGYNNTALDAVRRAWKIQEKYGVEVIVFTWPSNGGGSRFLEDLHGKLSYKSDKSDARSSIGALDRVLSRMHDLIMQLNKGVFSEASDWAKKHNPHNAEERKRLIAQYLRKQSCPFNVSILAHSMGNYLYKKMLLSSDERLSRNIYFDNVILKAADANHSRHRERVEKINIRQRVYILINTNDSALGLSTRKVGDQQEPRLGNTIAHQNAANATYIDFTGSIGDEHSYFTCEDITTDLRKLEVFFKSALNGENAHGDLKYRADMNTYKFE